MYIVFNKFPTCYKKIFEINLLFEFTDEAGKTIVI